MGLEGGAGDDRSMLHTLGVFERGVCHLELDM
jgi:hypothetical protein